MNLDPFGSSSWDLFNPKPNKDIFSRPRPGGIRRPRKAAEAAPEEERPEEKSLEESAAPAPEKKKPGVILRNPKWEVEKVGFNEETDISVEIELPPEQSHKTKVTFVLFALTPDGPERMVQAEAHAANGKVKCRIPIHIPGYRNEDGNLMAQVEYFFTAKHSDSELLDGSDNPKIVDETAERLIESHIVPGPHFDTDKSLLHPKQASALKDMCVRIKGWKEKYPDGKLAIFGHADAVGATDYNKTLSERRAKSVFAFLTKDASAWSDLDKQEKWGLAPIQDLLRELGHDPGASDGLDGPKTQAAVRSFQAKNGLPESGQADAGTRKSMYQGFMDGLNGLDLKAKDFDDVNGHPSAGCSEFNLIEQTQAACEANRRVAVLLVKSNPNFPIHYPCTKGGYQPCKSQAARKGDRRTPGFSCLFYDKLVQEKPSGGSVTGEAPKATYKVLSPWFIPGAPEDGGEFADIEIELSGPTGRADHFDWEVYGSGYCEAARKDDGTFTFTAIDKPVPLHSKSFLDAEAKPGPIKISDWSGEVSAAQGALKPQEGKKSFINVAFSPYTSLGRYYKAAADKESLLLLSSFWPAFKDKLLVPESLKVTWKVKGGKKLKLGALELIDKANALIFQRELAAPDCADGDHEFAWDGKTSAGTEITAESLPIRARIALWSEDKEAEPVALCAMQTEVRVFVHPETEARPAGTAFPQSLAFDLAPQAIKAPEEKEADAWAQYQLSEAGFHPGPIGGAFGDAAKIALKEFQRSHPKEEKAPFTRLKATGNRDADTMGALKRLKPDTRPWFGDIASRADLGRKDAGDLLSKADKEMIVWVDDRHTNTSAGSNPFFMDDYHGAFNIGDDRPKRDQASIPRPWIPLSASLSLMPKGSSLADTAGKSNAAAERALGFLRMDFRSVDAEPDHGTIDMGHAQYSKSLHRSHKWMQETYAGWSVDHNGAKQYNAPEAIGGLRPKDPKAYYKALFGIGADSFLPHLAAADDTAEAVSLRALPDDLAGKLPKERLGKFNVYFRPSIIAGDGYQIEASLGLGEEPAALGKFPNQKGLALRYPVAPKGRTAKLRVWRKASYRAYTCWAPAVEKHWPAQAQPAADLYRGANLHMIHEGGAPREFKVTDLVTAKEYSDNIKATVSHAHYASLSITLDTEKVWPYTKEKRLGIPQSPLNGTLKQFYRDVFDPMFNETWRRFREGLLHLLMQQAEKMHGLHRGYFLAEFRSSQRVDGVEYACTLCKSTIAEVINNLSASETLEGKACKKPGCKGTWMKSKARSWDGIPLPAVGVSMGGTWLFTSGDHSVWAHEIGHIRHLEHSPSQPGSTEPAPGGKADQHDSQTNPDPTLSNEPAKDNGWDRACIMSYKGTSRNGHFGCTLS